MNLFVPVVATATSPSPSIEIDGPDLEGDPSQLIWWEELVAGPLLRIVAIIVGAFLLRLILLRIIDRFVKKLSEPKEPGIITRTTRSAREVIGADVVVAERRSTRAASLGQLAKNLTSVTILVVAAIMALAELGFNLAPLIAGAGVIGVALGFGAQSVVADFLSGVFMLLEDQYGVGDIVDLGEASGVVEDVHLRVTRLRAVDGVVWYVRNGEILRVGNMSQNWSRALLDIGVAYDSDVEQVKRLMGEVAQQMTTEEQWSGLILEEPEVWGVEQLAADAITVRLVLKTVPGEQWGVARELRQRIKDRFDAEGVEIPFPQRTVWVRNQE